MDTRVAAIRNDTRVGVNSCSVIDECWGDTEIVEELDKRCITTDAEAVVWALKQEGLFLEQGLNQRWGEDNDSQLLAIREWEKQLKEFIPY